MDKHEEIFAVAKALPAEERAAYLDEACENSGMRGRVEALLRRAEEAGEFFADFEDVTEHAPLAGTPGTVIGRYKLLQKIGEGGMGEVWMAEQREPLERRVALKVIKRGMDTRQVIARFEAERQALALMEHPNIASVFDGGVTDTGRPYFVMELVNGIPVTKYCDRAKLSTTERLELFREICQAVAHSHQKGIIHRDLKPSNILVTNRDDRPVPKVIDFGVAKATAQRLTEKTLFTQYGQMIGTPAYMSPEQAEFSERDVDTRSDVYSLGVLLYEMLTGSTPFDDQELRKAAFDEMCRVIREDDPPRPSVKLSTLGERQATVAALQRTDAGRLARVVRGDLDWIVMRALEKDRSRRYQSADGFGEEIGRFLRDEPVEARQPTIGYRTRKFLRRHRRSVSVATIVALAILIGAVLMWRSVRATRAEYAYQNLHAASINSVPVAANEVRALLPRSEEKLRQDLKSGSADRRVRAAAVLSRDERGPAELLVDQFLDEPALRAMALSPLFEDIPREWIVERLRTVATDRENQESPARRVRASAILALSGTKLEVEPETLAEWLAREPVFGPAFESLAGELTPPLKQIFDRRPRGPAQVNAAQLLSTYLRLDSGALAELIATSDPAQFRPLLHSLRNHRGSPATLKRNLEQRANVLGEMQIRLATLTPPQEEEGDRLAREQSVIILALFHLGEREEAWSVLRENYPADPRLRYFLIHGFADYEVQPEQLLRKTAEDECPPGIQQGLLSAWADYDKTHLPPARRREQSELLQRLRGSDDRGLRSMARWLSAQWDLETDDPKSQGAGWRINRRGIELARFPRNALFLMAPVGPTDEIPPLITWCRIPWSYELSIKPVTFGEFEKFRPGSLANWDTGLSRPTMDHPIESVPIGEIRRFCNWLSEQDGLAPEQFCYEEVEGGNPAPKENYLKLTGYRLPIEAEWEHACRSGSQTRCFFGSSPLIADRYMHHKGNSDSHTWPCEDLRPNSFGMFSILGNNFEAVGDYGPISGFELHPKSNPLVADERWLEKPELTSLRGGRYNIPARNQNAGRFLETDIELMHGHSFSPTFRVARTIQE